MPRLQKSTENKEYKDKQIKDRKENNKKTRVEKKKEKSYCNDCKIYINTQNMSKHVLTQKHLNKNISPNNNGQNEKDYCLVCSGKYTKTNLTKHEKTAKHIKALREIKQQ